ncbi:MAG: GldG family protein [Myxococcales bacterium]|nr:GldG family protein [Myxococcales bacterium]MCB9641963.1 GldG family protein [Myxococcales bacterium]
MLNSFFPAWMGATTSAWQTYQPYLIVLGVAIAMAVGSVLIWKMTFDFSDSKQQKDAKLWGLYLSFFGALLIFGGFFWYQIIEQFTTRIAILEGVALGLVLGMYAVGTFSFDRSDASKSNLFTGLSAVVLFAALAALGGINYYANENSKKYDFNENKLQSLTNRTTKVVKALRTKVRIVGFFFKREKSAEDTAREFFKKYRDINREQLDYHFYDPMQNPEIAACYGIRYGGAKNFAGRVLLTAGRCEEGNTKAKKNAGGLVFKGKKIVLDKFPPTEQEVTNKIVRISRKSKKVCFATGHSQPDMNDASAQGFKGLNTVLKDRGFETMEVNLFNADEIPNTCDVLVQASADGNLLRAQGIANAKLSEKEVRLIERYVSGGGRLLVMHEPQSPSGLEEFLAKYGVKVSNGLIVDFFHNLGRRFGGPLSVATQNYPNNHPITEGFRGRVASGFVYASPLSVDRSKSGANIVELIKTNPTRLRIPGKQCCTFYFPDPNNRKFFGLLSASRRWKRDEMLRQVIMGNLIQNNFKGAKGGTFTLAAAISKKIKKSKKDLRMVVFGDATFASNILLRENETLVMNAISWLAQEEDQIHIPPKQRKPTSLRLTSLQRNFLRYSNRYGMPLFFLCLIFLVSAIRRTQ